MGDVKLVSIMNKLPVVFGWESNLMQMHGNFEGFFSKWCIVWLGNLTTPVFQTDMGIFDPKSAFNTLEEWIVIVTQLQRLGGNDLQFVYSHSNDSFCEKIHPFFWFTSTWYVETWSSSKLSISFSRAFFQWQVLIVIEILLDLFHMSPFYTQRSVAVWLSTAMVLVGFSHGFPVDFCPVIKSAKRRSIVDCGWLGGCGQGPFFYFKAAGRTACWRCSGWLLVYMMISRLNHLTFISYMYTLYILGIYHKNTYIYI